MQLMIGQKIAQLRKEKGLTQEALSEQLGVSPQAVSKWENNISIPDITLLPQLSQLFNVSVDELLSIPQRKETAMLIAEHEKKNAEDLVFRIVVDSPDGDKVRVNLPMPLMKMGLEIGMRIPQITDSELMSEIDFKQIIRLVENGVVGKIVEIDGADGDRIEISVE